ncbi:uncharacterized protein EKO05_0001144 [Ascochyta rabiei]|uniref:Sequence-specific DNA binding n=1 Tax=Didymella rabiei TaxID=5454 RepID=A0A163LUH9_DIDRA|nr:uncharacterized protein EKO05_0001144 [Ascochyta rabiei]KZM28132.1 sequence-specific DNA binding [Ascochyta rabiei]UPX10486.1 hypothetical protein EKO05_0001144 [Ascochyta rabiei]
MTEVQHPQSFDWANDAYAAFSDQAKPQNNWAAFGSSSSTTDTTAALTIPPALLTHSAERFGQITPPDERSPADSVRAARDSSIPVEELMNEALWPQHTLSATEHRPSTQAELQQSQPPSQNSQSPLKRRHASRQSASSQAQASASTYQDNDATVTLQPPKRKRGRPKSQPQMVEAYTADGYPFQVSSARQSHLEKNRVAAHKCRQRKKEYIGGLEGRAREFSAKNKALKESVAILREEVLGLKNEVLRHAGCGFWAVDEYLARCAGDLLGMQPPDASAGTNTLQHHVSPFMHQIRPRQDSHDSIHSLGSMSSTPGADGFGGLELLKDYEDDVDDQS